MSTFKSSEQKNSKLTSNEIQNWAQTYMKSISFRAFGMTSPVENDGVCLKPGKKN